MILLGSPKPTPVSASGADAGRVLRGVGRSNEGIRLVIQEAQPRGCHGPLTGRFVILETGENMHAPSLAGLVDRPTDAAEVLALIRRHHPGCVNVVNTNILVLEPGEGPGAPPQRPAPGAPPPHGRAGTGSDADS